jgi:hypothetical protein
MELSALLAKTDDEILFEVGASIMNKGVGSGGLPKSHYVKLARAWLARNKEEICSIVCADKRFAAAISKNAHLTDTITIAFDVLNEHVLHFAPVPVASIAVLFVRLGYEKLCPGHGDAPPKAEPK